jgi:regulator of sigma E protease
MIFSILILAVAFLSLIALMIIHEFGHFIIAKKFGVHVEEFGIGYPPRIFGKKMGETLYSINWVLLGAFVKIRGEEGVSSGSVDDYRSFTNLKIWQRVLIVIGGVVAFWVTAIIIFSIVFWIGADLPVGDQDIQGLTNPRIVVVQVAPDSPASQAGLNNGDIITKVNNISVNKIIDFQKITGESKGEIATIVVDRHNREISFNLAPRENPPEGQGAVGIALERIATLAEKYPWYQTPIKGLTYTWKITVDSLKGLWLLLLNLASGKGAPQGAEFAGPVGITVFLANAASYGIGFFLYFIGIICVFISIFNLFPIPALDGGKLMFLLIEKLRGKPVSPKTEQSITLVFFSILIVLSIFVTIKFDIPRFSDFLKSSIQR